MVIKNETLTNSLNGININLMNPEITLKRIEKGQNLEYRNHNNINGYKVHTKNSKEKHKSDFISSIEKLYLKNQVSKIQIGDLVKIGVYIKEGNKDRIQYYQGLIIGKNNAGINLTITVRKVFQGIGVERKFLIHSPKFESIEILKSSRVRRSKLYYLRKFSEKGSRLKPRFVK
uniref:50S ribosomal protein L19, chloroplastic n=1 Tax=Protohalopteris sp. TaxID=2843287 RepID=A0A8F0F724_9PHAE|nr:ribosomal protein L19 [Protohalopteris sp.]